MSAFTGRVGKGARADLRAAKRQSAVARQATRDSRPPAAPTCPTGKVCYRDEHEAQIELVGTVVARNRGRARRKEQRAYQCPYCGSWHLTKTPVMRAEAGRDEE